MIDMNTFYIVWAISFENINNGIEMSKKWQKECLKQVDISLSKRENRCGGRQGRPPKV